MAGKRSGLGESPMPVYHSSDARVLHVLPSIFSELDLSRLLSKVARETPRLVGTRGCSVFLYRKVFDDFELKATSGLAQRPSERAAYKAGEGLTGWICKHGLLLKIKDVTDKDELARIGPDLAWEKKVSEITSDAGKPYLGAPLV